MSAPQVRVRRLSRLARLARADVTRGEVGLAQAVQEASAAASRSASIATFMAETAPPVGREAAGFLMSGAHLRALLQPAATAAAATERETAARQADAERRLQVATARAETIAEKLADARRLAASETERRAADLTPAAARRR